MRELDYAVASPDGRVVVRFGLLPNVPPNQWAARKVDCAHYCVQYRGLDVVLDSQLGLKLGGMASLGTTMRVVGVSERSHSEVWRLVGGTRRGWFPLIRSVGMALSLRSSQRQ